MRLFIGGMAMVYLFCAIASAYVTAHVADRQPTPQETYLIRGLLGGLAAWGVGG